MKKIISLIFAFIFTFGIFSIQTTGSDQITPLWNNTIMVDGYFSFNGTKATYYGYVAGQPDVTDIIAFAKLYYKDSGGGWVEIPMPWGFLTQNTDLNISEEFEAESGVEYKVELEATVYVDYDGEVVNHTAYGKCP